MSDAVHRIAGNRLTRGLAAATATLGLAGGALALAMSGGSTAGAAAGHHAEVAAPVTAQASHGGGNWPYFACAGVLGYGVCIGPPTT